jgi:hypothetical protein
LSKSSANCQGSVYVITRKHLHFLRTWHTFIHYFSIWWNNVGIGIILTLNNVPHSLKSFKSFANKWKQKMK